MTISKSKRVPNHPPVKPVLTIHNPRCISVDDLEPHLGWRFLCSDEIIIRAGRIVGLEMWEGNSWYNDIDGLIGGGFSETYRTKLPYPIP